jgi:hypothetical protein
MKTAEEKKTFWLVTSNFDLSNTVADLETVKDLIDGDYDNQSDEDRKEVEYTIKPVLMTDEEYEKLPEGD